MNSLPCKQSLKNRILATPYTHAKFPNAPSTRSPKHGGYGITSFSGLTGEVERISGRVIHSVKSGSIWDHLNGGLNSRTLSRSRVKELRRQLCPPIYGLFNLQQVSCM
jgi:hypothetical protein